MESPILDKMLELSEIEILQQQLYRYADDFHFLNQLHTEQQGIMEQAIVYRGLIQRLELAIENGEFCLFFQPKVDVQKGIVFGAEALIRWKHPELGLMAPDSFLPQIAQHEFMLKLDAWVINEALAHMTNWLKCGLQLKVSINVTALSLQTEGFVEQLSRALQRYSKINPENFELEILETEALTDLTKAECLIKACQELGVSVALDDFGTGYCSLSYLRQLPVQAIKIDCSFVCDMLDNEEDRTLVQAVIGLAHSFRRLVIAEGVESIEHGVALMQLGCYQFQGYGIAKPMPASEWLAWLNAWKMPKQWRSSAISSDEKRALSYNG